MKIIWKNMGVIWQNMGVIRENMGVIWQSMKIVSKHIWLWYEKIIDILGCRTIAMLAAALFITMVSVLFSDHWLVSIERQDMMISQVRTNILTLHKLKANLYKAESAQRGYLFTRRSMYVGPFNRALNDARDNIEKIESLVLYTSTGNDQQEEREWLKAISASLEAKATEMRMTLNLSKSGKTNEARQVMNLDEGILEMKKFMEYTDTLIKNQNGDLDAMIKARKDTLSLARTSLYGGALILIVLVVLVIKQLLSEISVKSQLQHQLERENEIYERKSQQQSKLLRSLALDYQADVERERQKLSRELHDELGSIFTATKMDMAWVIKKLKDAAPEIVDKLKKTNRYIDQGISYQRHIVQELHPAMLSTFGFWPALKSLIDDAAERNQWQLTLSLPDQNTKLNETISLVAYRIVQETLNNANKYAKASAVSVHVMMDEQFLKLEIEDNGVGVDMNILDGNTHGLSGMRHRVLAIGGHFEILSEPGKGVLTRALIPLDIRSS
ncbi:MAG TPA: CHASE3 domain-containing protein [Methylotenera sp.]|nr:CHASE3 domain-containing protein [Methylotenera sp.]